MDFVAEDDVPASNFTMMANHIFRDPRLSDKDKGRIGYLATHAPGYRVTMEQQIAEGTDGRDAIYATLKRLVKYGYIKRQQKRRADGTLGPVEYTWGSAFKKQEYTRAWGSGGDKSPGQTASGFSGSGEPGSGAAASGESATKKNNPKKIKEKKIKPSPLPPVEQPTPEPVDAVEPGGDDSSNQPPQPQDPVRQLIVELGNIRADFGEPWKWLEQRTHAALSDPAVARKPFPLVRAALVELAAGTHGTTHSPKRVCEMPEQWWQGVADRLAARTPKTPSQRTAAISECGLCDGHGWRLEPGSTLPVEPAAKCSHKVMAGVS
jgi:hypothetical protein